MAKKLKNSIDKELGKGVIAFLTPEEWVEARGWKEDCCQVYIQESPRNPDERPGRAYYAEVLMFSPGKGNRISCFTHNYPKADMVAGYIKEILDNHEYEGNITFEQNGKSRELLNETMAHLSQIYEKGEVKEKCKNG